MFEICEHTMTPQHPEAGRLRYALQMNLTAIGDATYSAALLNSFLANFTDSGRVSTPLPRGSMARVVTSAMGG